MEFPSIGKHCSDKTCSQLDFLPFTCQYCKQIYCQDHWRLEGHTCSNKEAASLQDQRVPICPLCDKPVPVKRGEDPNLRMEQHIAAGCPEPATTTSKPIYTNSCNAKGCKNRSMVPVVCQSCRLNYCLKHRLEGDHACKGTGVGANRNGNGNGQAPAKKVNGATTTTQGNNNNQGSNNWSLKAANAARNARAGAAAQQRANNNSQSQSRQSSSAGKKDKDKCTIS
ncbi:zinc finger, AN1-type domain [Mortierella sp. GBA35]|nr:zinc finger, AN1-type domain [Mortierella sp. AD031]KAF9106480.1 zinc finger, AN1-type domain [Mortierella sp. GBA35]KAG0218814.1 zinc finger, AN1-type domain [Mortierella sp. NVP41]